MSCCSECFVLFCVFVFARAILSNVTWVVHTVDFWFRVCCLKQVAGIELPGYTCNRTFLGTKLHVIQISNLNAENIDTSSKTHFFFNV